MNAGELCNRDVVTITRDAGIIDAAKLMRDHHVGCLVVVENREGQTEPVGILTDRDIVIEVMRRVPVIRDSGELAGILALDDILEMLSEELTLLARLTSREAEQEQKKRA